MAKSPFSPASPGPADQIDPASPVADTPPATDPVDPAPPAPDAPEAAAVQTFLTTRHTDRYGPGGRFLDLSPDAAAPGLKPGEDGEGPELTVPTADQLARRRPAP